MRSPGQTPPWAPWSARWHFDTPLYIEENLGGWENRDTIDLFVKYATACFREFKGLVHNWLTFNEINNTIMFLGFSGHTSDEDYQRAYQHLHNKFVASAKAVQIGHAIDGENQIGCMICGIAWYPATSPTPSRATSRPVSATSTSPTPTGAGQPTRLACSGTSRPPTTATTCP